MSSWRGFPGCMATSPSQGPLPCQPLWRVSHAHTRAHTTAASPPSGVFTMFASRRRRKLPFVERERS